VNLARAKLAAFLNKKSWHTGGMPMQAEVWKREQEKAHEARKVEEMKREIAEERKMQELTDQAAEAGHVQKVERLEFMYKGGPGMGGPGMGAPGMGVPSEDADAYLMGEKRFEAPGGDDALARARDAPGSLLAAHPEAAKNETWNKLNSDPLLTMRVQEQEARRAITRNPAEAARARAELERRRREKKEKKRARKEEKKAAKRARKEKIRAEVRREVLGENAETASRGRSTRHDGRGKKTRKAPSEPRVFRVVVRLGFGFGFGFGFAAARRETRAAEVAVEVARRGPPVISGRQVISKRPVASGTRPVVSKRPAIPGRPVISKRKRPSPERRRRTRVPAPVPAVAFPAARRTRRRERAGRLEGLRADLRQRARRACRRGAPGAAGRVAGTRARRARGGG